MSENKEEKDIMNNLELNEINTKNQNNIKLKIIDKLESKHYHHSKTVNLFIIFNSINNILCLIYPNERYSIISYDLINKKKINEIKNAHNEFISTFRHIVDKENKRDLIISISDENNSFKL